MHALTRLVPTCLALALVFVPPALAETPPVVVGLVVDTSGSLTPDDLDKARSVADGVLGALPPGSEVAVFGFDDQSRLVLPRTSDVSRVREALGQLARGGRYTALYDALWDVSRHLHESPARRAAIVLITDGKDENSAVHLEDGLRTAIDSRIPVFALGVGRVQERTLRRIAKLTGGDYGAAARAEGSAIAKAIMDRPEVVRGTPPAAPTVGGPTAAEAAAAAPAPARAAVPAASRPAAAEKPGRWRTLLVVLGALALGAVVLLLALRRRRAPAQCPTCGRDLDSPLATCPACAAAPATQAPATRRAAGAVFSNGPRAEASSRPAADLGTGGLDGLSATVIERMSSTEEYLEKTITMRERPVLSVTKGPAAGEIVELSQETATSLGRSRANDFVVQDVAVSGQHCRIRPEDGAFVLHDLNSTNGTFVNDRQVTRHVLAEGDVVRLGDTQLVFKREQRIIT